MGQFFYKRIVKAEKEGEEDKVVLDSFNPEFAIRGVHFKESYVVLLNDGHEESDWVGEPKFNKQGKMVELPERRRVYKISEITLDEEDTSRFMQLTWVGLQIPSLKLEFEEESV